MRYRYISSNDALPKLIEALELEEDDLLATCKLTIILQDGEPVRFIREYYPATTHED